jgi:hypothetical protein
VQARGHDLNEIVVRGSVALENRAGSDVHVGACSFEVQKRGVKAGQPVSVGHPSIFAGLRQILRFTGGLR